MRAEDVAAAARLHGFVFPDYFLTHLGQQFLERFYAEFASQPGNYGLVATCDQRLIGCVIGTSNSQACYDRFYRHNLGMVAWTLLQRLVLDAYVRQNIGVRMAHAGNAVRSLLGRKRTPTPASETTAPGPIAARLLSIGVDPDWRGQGIAAELVARFCRQVWQDGAEWVGLSVRAENHGAIAFYRETGWQQEGTNDTTVRFFRSTEPPASRGSEKDA